MSYQFNISDIGLRLIKAYEGFWPEARPLLSGGQVVGFGHRVEADEAVVLTEDEAEDVLKADLAPVEDLINSRVHASMTQSQFDALCSLVFSIGEEAFLSSRMLHALNQGQVLEAANEFDLWRKGNIEGQIYVVDALVRRRTAEKALFLRPTQRIARAPRYELSPVRDGGWAASTSSQNDAPAPSSYSARAQSAPARPVSRQPEPEPDHAPFTPRRELAAPPAKVLYADDDTDDILGDLTVQPLLAVDADVPDDSTLSMTLEDVASDPADISVADLLDDVSGVEYASRPSAEDRSSPIAEAAAAVSQRLDALIEDNAPPAKQAEGEAWPDNLITSSISPVNNRGENVVRMSENAKGASADVVIDELQQDDALREQIARESQYNVDRYDSYVDMPEDHENARSLYVFIAMIVIGLIAGLSGLIINLRGSANILGENGPFIAIAAMLLGALLVVVGGLYLTKLLFSQE